MKHWIPALAAIAAFHSVTTQAARTAAPPVTYCNIIESDRMYVHSTKVPEYYKILLPGTLELKPGPVTQFQVMNQDDQAVPEVAASLTGRIERVSPFYQEKRQVPQPRGQTQPRTELRKVYAVTAIFKSTAYDLAWVDGGDYQYLGKELTRNLFCTAVEDITETSSSQNAQ